MCIDCGICTLIEVCAIISEAKDKEFHEVCFLGNSDFMRNKSEKSF